MNSELTNKQTRTKQPEHVCLKKEEAQLDHLKSTLQKFDFDLTYSNPIDYDVPLNSKNQNANLKVANILPDAEMLKYGFTQHRLGYWYYAKALKHVQSIEFNVTINIKTKTIAFDVLDSDWCQPYDYQAYLENVTAVTTKKAMAFLVHAQVQQEMQRLVDAGILTGFTPNTYI